MSQRSTRRTFIKQVGFAGATLPVLMPALVRAESPNGMLRVAFIGTAGRGGAHVGEMAGRKDIECTAFCDVDKNHFGKVLGRWKEAKGFTDYRKMYDEESKNFDAVFVATPDHSHFPAAMIGLKLDKAVYCEKPLTWSSREARLLGEEAMKRKLPTQMGNQGHAGGGWRVVVGWIKGGAIGDVKEVHTWTNRPVWPQSPEVAASVKGRNDTVPGNLDWESWIGPAPMRPYVNGVYHGFKWRGWYDFGAGALGDMACHTMDGTFWAMDPGHAKSVELVAIKGWSDDCFPVSSIVKWEFPANDKRPGFTQFWYDGTPQENNKPPKPEGMDDETYKTLPNSGNLFIGTKGILRVWGDYGDSPRLVGEEFLKEVGKPKDEFVPEPSPGHHKEFVMAAKGEKDYLFPKSNFGYAAPMTETILLGVVAQRLNKVGQKYEYDGANLKFTNSPEASAMLWREPRKGWDVLGTTA